MNFIEVRMNAAPLLLNLDQIIAIRPSRFEGLTEIYVGNEWWTIDKPYEEFQKIFI